jgi:hypothetical protein
LSSVDLYLRCIEEVCGAVRDDVVLKKEIFRPLQVAAAAASTVAE